MKILTNNKQHEICLHILANTIAAFDLLDLQNMDADKVIRYTNSLIDNTMDAVYKVGRLRELQVAHMIIKRYKKGER